MESVWVGGLSEPVMDMEDGVAVEVCVGDSEPDKVKVPVEVPLKVSLYSFVRDSDPLEERVRVMELAVGRVADHVCEGNNVAVILMVEGLQVCVREGESEPCEGERETVLVPLLTVSDPLGPDRDVEMVQEIVLVRLRETVAERVSDRDTVPVCDVLAVVLLVWLTECGEPLGVTLGLRVALSDVEGVTVEDGEVELEQEGVWLLEVVGEALPVDVVEKLMVRD